MSTKLIPIRKCIGCGLMKPKDNLIRVVKSNLGAFSVDFTLKSSGRGAYICKNETCINKVVKNKGLDRAFKRKVSKEIYEILLGELDE
ncbi:nucleic acid-binding protein [Candidatus Epulonipiscioides gigas]|nr:nucleic acid-binding protein [Epulopiscium sp. SCG-C07WGA-EpuloA2]